MATKCGTKKACGCKKAPAAPAKPMTKAEMIAAVAEAAGCEKKTADAVYTAILGVVAQQATTPAGFTLPGLGKISVAERSARMGRNPATGETMEIAAKKVLKFSFSKICKDAVLGTK